MTTWIVRKVPRPITFRRLAMRRFPAAPASTAKAVSRSILPVHHGRTTVAIGSDPAPACSALR